MSQPGYPAPGQQGAPAPSYAAPTPTGLPTAQPYPPGQPQPQPQMYYAAPPPSYAQPGYAAPPPGYVAAPPGYQYQQQVVMEGTPLVAPMPLYFGLALTHENAHIIAAYFRRRGIWLIVLGSILLISSIVTTIVLMTTFNFFWVGFFFPIMGGFMIGWGIRYLRMARHLEHHGTLP